MRTHDAPSESLALGDTESDAQYFVIRINHANAGFFCYMTFAINQLAHCEREGHIPVVNFGEWAEDGINGYFDAEYGENTWDYYFEPVAGISYEDLRGLVDDPEHAVVEKDVIAMSNDELWHLHIADPRSVYPYPYGYFRHKSEFDESWYLENRRKANRFIEKYVRLKPHIVDLVEKSAELFRDEHVLGVHMRGTDKGSADSDTQLMKIITPEQYFPYIDRYTQEHGDCKIFVATDQAQFVDTMRARYGDRILTLEASRTRGHTATFQQRRKGSNYKKGEEVLLDCLLLSRCDFLLKCCSAVGEFAMYFNPNLRCIDLNHEYSGYTWRDRLNNEASLKRQWLREELSRWKRRLKYGTLPRLGIRRRWARLRRIADYKSLHKRIVNRRVKRKKRAVEAKGLEYHEAPSVSFVIQSFNHRDNIPLIAERLHQFPTSECIVCEDGSVDGSQRAWLEHMDRPNDIVICSNDLHEIRTYGPAIRYCSSEIICLLQDDDAPPASPAWLEDAHALFRAHPRLVLLGGFLGFRDLASENHGPNGPFRGDLTNPYQETLKPPVAEETRFRFVEAINVGPFFVRRKPFLEMGGFDSTYSSVGWPGIHFDVEVSLRAWLQGFQVGWYDSRFHQLGERGTESFGNRGRRLQQLATNHGKLVEKYAGELPRIQELVSEANRSLT